MKRHLIGVLIIGGIIGGITLNTWYESASAPIVYAAASEPIELKPVLYRAETQEERIIRKIEEAFPEEPRMVKVAWCESRYNPRAIGPTQDFGLFQLHNPSHDLSGIDVFDVDDNIAFARKLYDQYGLKPWRASADCWM